MSAPPAQDSARPSWLYRAFISADHKAVGLRFLFGSLFFMLVAGSLAMLMRWQLGWPGRPVPVLGNLLGPLRDMGGILPPEVYASVFSQHGTLMVFFVVIPLAVNFFGNYLVPLLVGAPQMAFPRLAALSWWLWLAGGAVALGGFWAPGGAAASGWTAYPPLSALATVGQDWWIVALVLAGLSSILGGVCMVTTIVNRRAPGMTWGRLPVMVWAMLVTAALTLLAVPALCAALAMLWLDRHAGTQFFLPASLVVSGERLGNVGGGQPLLWQHLFWFYAHPAVYIMILPGMGIVSELLPVFSRKPLFGYRWVTGSMCSIALLGFLVWGHHMFQSGMNPLLGTAFMVSTMAIAAPSAVEMFSWLATLWRGSIRLATPMLFALGFLSLFAIGGLSGVFAASTPVDIHVHDTYFIVAHLHYVVFGGSLFAIFAGVYYWFPRMFGVRLNELLGRIHFVATYVAFNCTFFPMHLLGLAGMPRRIYDPTTYPHLARFQGVNEFISVSAFVLFSAQVVFAANFVAGLVRARRAPREVNPWQANTLEWSATATTAGECADLPRVVRGPYEYSRPGQGDDRDYYPQAG